MAGSTSIFLPARSQRWIRGRLVEGLGATPTLVVRSHRERSSRVFESEAQVSGLCNRTIRPLLGWTLAESLPRRPTLAPVRLHLEILSTGRM